VQFKLAGTIGLFVAFWIGLPTIHAFDLAIHGYYRNRIEYFHDLDTQQPNVNVNQGGLGDNDRAGSLLFTQQRFRIEPMMKLNDNISIHSQIDVLDNILFGTHDTEQFDFLSPIIGTIQIPGAGGSLGTIGPSEVGKFRGLNVRRVYADLLSPIGKFRIGRQPSHWGLGIFQNDGNGPEDDFGDSADRFTYLASIDLAQMEASVVTREGHVISFGTVIDVAFSSNQDPRDEGLGALIDGPSRNMWQFAVIGLYDNPRFSIGTFTGLRYRNGKEGNATTQARPILVQNNVSTVCDPNLNINPGSPCPDSNGNNQLGALQPSGNDGNTRLWFTDIYAKVNLTDEISIGGEYIFMNGKLSTGIAIDAIPFNSLPAGALGSIDLPAQNGFRVQLAALEAKGDHSFGEWIVQTGYASGDAQPLSNRVTQFGFRPDYQLGLLLFHVPLGSSPRISQQNGLGAGSRVLVGAVPVTGNFINNAIFGAIGYKHKLNLTGIGQFISDARVGLKVITALAPSDNFNIDFAEMTGIIGLPTVVNSNKWYGVEFDVSLAMTLFEKFTLELMAAYLYAGPAYDIEVQVFNPTNLAQINVIPFDGADNVIGTQLSLRYKF